MDKTLVDERVAQFRDQTRRFLNGELNDDEFRHLRLRNGLYIQRHAPMLRVAIPYGLLSSPQLRKLAHIARKYDRNYGHFSKRQNLQFNWPRLADVPEILRQWSTFHPEFNYLPRKFKIAINGATADRIAILLHDIGLQALTNDAGEIGLRVSVGGGMGRTPMIGHV